MIDVFGEVWDGAFGDVWLTDEVELGSHICAAAMISPRINARTETSGRISARAMVSTRVSGEAEMNCE